MVDILSITALVVAVITALGAFVKEAHIQKCKGLCFESDCRKRSSPPSSTESSISEEPLPTPPVIVPFEHFDHYNTFRPSRPINIISES